MIRKAVYVNLAIASLVLVVTSVLLVTSPSRLAYHGWLALLEFVFYCSLVLLPPVQLIGSTVLLLASRESRKSPLGWFLLLTIAFSLASGFFMLAAVAGVAGA